MRTDEQVRGVVAADAYPAGNFVNKKAEMHLESICLTGWLDNVWKSCECYKTTLVGDYQIPFPQTKPVRMGRQGQEGRQLRG